MITSNGNQYLPPDYFSLPTTLDAKKSPLALLAQTCSQIGADTPSKNLSSEKSNKKLDVSRDKYSPSSSNSSRCSPITPKSSNYKPYESNFGMKEQYYNGDDKSDKTDENKNKTAVSKSSPSSRKSSESGSIVSLPSSSPGGGKMPRKTHTPQDTSQVMRSYSNPPTTSPLSGKTADSISSLKSLSSMPSSSSANYFPAYPSSLPLDLMTSSLLQSSLKAGLNPYLNYTRMKAPSGSDSLMPVCRDPYCTSCQLSSHLLATAAAVQCGKPPCPAGCTQCSEIKSAGLLSNSHGNAIAAVYAQAQLAALAAASQMPYVCSWVGVDATYCGKRFVTSEELLQHLRTHTSDTFLNASAHSLLNRTYPTPPLSPLSASRYHPYSKSPYLQSSMFPFQNNSALPPTFSPYFLYGSKLGSTHQP